MHVGYLNIVIIAAEGDRPLVSYSFYFTVNNYLVYYTLKQNASKNTIFLPKTVSLHVEK